MAFGQGKRFVTCSKVTKIDVDVSFTRGMIESSDMAHIIDLAAVQLLAALQSSATAHHKTSLI